MSTLLQRTAAALGEQADLRYDYSQIDEAHRTAVRDAAVEIKRTMQRSAAVIGGALAVVKSRLDHGQWSAWLATEFEWSERTAENAMNAARLVAKNEKFSVLGDSSQYLLGAPSTPEPAKAKVLQMIESGGSGKDGRVTVQDVKRAISDYKPPSVDLKLKKVVGKCKVCQRQVTDPESVAQGCGPDCRKKLAAQGGPDEVRAVVADVRFVEPETPEDPNISTFERFLTVYPDGWITISMSGATAWTADIYRDMKDFEENGPYLEAVGGSPQVALGNLAAKLLHHKK